MKKEKVTPEELLNAANRIAVEERGMGAVLKPPDVLRAAQMLHIPDTKGDKLSAPALDALGDVIFPPKEPSLGDR